jgi:membrane protein YdbS with pleckstrin-like domain
MVKVIWYINVTSKKHKKERLKYIINISFEKGISKSQRRIVPFIRVGS